MTWQGSDRQSACLSTSWCAAKEKLTRSEVAVRRLERLAKETDEEEDAEDEVNL